jgi:hypothetical protein
MQKQAQKTVFRVIDALDAPYRGKVIRLKLESGQAPSVKELRDSSLQAVPPDGGDQESLRVVGFYTPGGKPSDGRLQRTGRVDLVVVKENGEAPPAVAIRWIVTGPQ